jgi:hypothetical protein
MVVTFIVFVCFFDLFIKLKLCKNERHLWIENIVESIYTTPFFSTSNVETVEYVDPQKVVAKKN